VICAFREIAGEDAIDASRRDTLVSAIDSLERIFGQRHERTCDEY
jgi:hypothetical protein